MTRANTSYLWSDMTRPQGSTDPEVIFDPQAESGALDILSCPNRDRWGDCRCTPVCAVCGWPPHSSVHGPIFRAEPGSRPVGHEYQAES